MKIIRCLSLVLILSTLWTNLALGAIVLTGTPPEKLQEGAYPITDFINPEILSKIIIIDVRTPQEFHAGHLPSAINLPMGPNLDTELKKLPQDKDIVLICAAGRRASKAFRSFKSANPELAKNLYFLDASLAYQPTGKVTIRPN